MTDKLDAVLDDIAELDHCSVCMEAAPYHERLVAIARAVHEYKDGLRCGRRISLQPMFAALDALAGDKHG